MWERQRKEIGKTKVKVKTNAPQCYKKKRSFLESDSTWSTCKQKVTIKPGKRSEAEPAGRVRWKTEVKPGVQNKQIYPEKSIKSRRIDSVYVWASYVVEISRSCCSATCEREQREKERDKGPPFSSSTIPPSSLLSQRWFRVNNLLHRAHHPTQLHAGSQKPTPRAQNGR